MGIVVDTPVVSRSKERPLERSINKMIKFVLLVMIIQYVAGIEIPGVQEGLPVQQLYQPTPAPKIPVRQGERRCDNFYNGEIPPCLLRPWLPPFSYSTTEGDNGEYRRRRRSNTRIWRTIHY